MLEEERKAQGRSEELFCCGDDSEIAGRPLCSFMTSSEKLIHPHSYCLLLLEMTMKNPQELPLCPVLIQPDIDDEPPRKRLKSDSGSQTSTVRAARFTLSHTRDANSQRPSPLRVDNAFSKKSSEAWFQRVPKRQSSREQPPKQPNLIQTCRSGNALRKPSPVSAFLSLRSDPKALPLLLSLCKKSRP
jgi:hypothetical protein